MSAAAAHAEPRATPGDAEYRYGVVLLILLALVVFEIVAPSTDWERAITVGLAGAALIVAVATSRMASRRRRDLELVVAAVVALLVVGIAPGAVSAAFAHAAVAVIVLVIPITIVNGLVRLIGERGATPQAIAGALSIYILLGVLFASVIGVFAVVKNQPYFTQGPDVSNGDRVYYSFTVLTTTGFGDYTAATPGGHALAVLEMLFGQLYLVTVIGVLIGHYISRRTQAERSR